MKYGCNMDYMGGVCVILVEYGWNGLDGMNGIIKKGKIETF